MSETAVGQNVPIDELVSELRALPESAFRELDRVRQLLRAKPVDPSSLQQYLCWDPHHYTRNLIDKTHRCRTEPTDIIEMNPLLPCAVDPKEPVHSVYNPREWSQRAVSLHVYSRPFDSCEVYSVEQGTCGDIQLHYTTVKGVPVRN